MLKPLCYSVLANLKKRSFTKKLKTEKFVKNNISAPNFQTETAFFENWLITGPIKTQTCT